MIGSFGRIKPITRCIYNEEKRDKFMERCDSILSSLESSKDTNRNIVIGSTIGFGITTVGLYALPIIGVSTVITSGLALGCAFCIVVGATAMFSMINDMIDIRTVTANKKIAADTRSYGKDFADEFEESIPTYAI
ncbi:MAG: hypothetical protein ACOC3V_03845 [bacterium]